MQNEIILLIIFAVLMIGYYLYVLYKTLKYKRKFGKKADAQDLYLRTNIFHFLFFGNLFRSNGKSDYKILKEEEESDRHKKSL